MAPIMIWPIVFHVSILLSLAHSSRRETQRPQHHRLHHLSRAFSRVWDGPEIHTERLLEACQIFANVLKETGPQAVRRDFCGNLQKARILVDRAKSHPRSIQTNLGAILLYERDIMDIHAESQLKDPSGAVGLLWMRRSLEFQTELYFGSINGKQPKEAALTAYRTRLQPFHGPVLRRFYTTFFRYKMPTRHTMLRRLGSLSCNGEYEEKIVIKDLRLLIQTWRPILDKWKGYFVEVGMEDTRRV